MATTKKTTTTKKTGVTIETTDKKTTARRKTGTTTGTKTTTTTSTTNEVTTLREQVATLEKKLNNLIAVLHTELTTEMLQGPRGTARKLEEAGLTEQTIHIFLHNYWQARSK